MPWVQIPAAWFMVWKIHFSDLWLVSTSIKWDDAPHTHNSLFLGKYMCKEPNSMSIKTAQWVKANAKPGDLSLVSRTHGVEEETDLSCPLTPASLDRHDRSPTLAEASLGDDLYLPSAPLPPPQLPRL